MTRLDKVMFCSLAHCDVFSTPNRAAAPVMSAMMLNASATCALFLLGSLMDARSSLVKTRALPPLIKMSGAIAVAMTNPQM